MAQQRVLIRTLVEIAESLVDDFDVIEVLTMLTDRCLEAFDVSDAGLMLAAPVGGELRLMTSSSVIMRDLELFELQRREGPCLECYRSGEPVVAADLGVAGDRWPRFAPTAQAAGFRSVAAVPMRFRGTVIGALNLFRNRPGPVGAEDLVGARALADVATIAILQHQAVVDARTVNEQLSHALNSRIIIEQAKGVLAERATIEIDEAFQWLRHHARAHRRTVVAVAEELINGELLLDALEPPPLR